jgi:glycosyltransferase involved in cell wall biosynthesis
MSRLWFDVEDLLRYGESGQRRPTGIQRGNFELYQALHETYGARVQFVRHRRNGDGFVAVSWSSIAACFERLTSTVTAAPTPPAGEAAAAPFVARGRLRRAAERLPPAIRLPLGRIVRGQIDSLRALPALAGGMARCLREALARPAPLAAGDDAPPPPPLDFTAEVKPGDALLILGAPMFRSDYDALARAARERHQLRFGLLVHDLVPVRHPEWQAREMVETFGAWMQRMLPLCDTVFAFSHATASDVERYASEHGFALVRPVCHLPHGQRRGGPLTAAPRRTPRLPEPGSYVLFVSTIEPRKNHALLFRIWRRLLKEMPAGQVPRLVFAGGVGWLVGDLLQQFANANWLDGKILFIREPDDAELAALYEGCLFTIYPSLYEGWGLPVTESLAFGKPCLAANTTSLPEAGGELARYFDPDNLHDALRVVRATLADRAGLAAWEAQVRRDFHPTPWSATAAAVLTAFSGR